MKEKSWHLVSYDICDPARLRKIGKILKGYGERKQLSVYCCHLTDRGRERLRWEVKKVMEEGDELLIIEICAHCIGRLRESIPKGAWPEDLPAYEIV